VEQKLWSLKHFVHSCTASHSTDYDCDCLAFALLSHGEDENMIHGTDSIISIDNLLLPLKHEANMKHFAGKPKLVFVQVALPSCTTSNNLIQIIISVLKVVTLCQCNLGVEMSLF